MKMYIKCVDKKTLQQMFAGSGYDVVWARPYFYKFKRSRIDSVEEFVHNDVDFKINCPLGGAIRALLKDTRGNCFVVNFYDYYADVLNYVDKDICDIYIGGMAKKFGAEYVRDCKKNNHDIMALRKHFVERYGKRATLNSDMIVKIPLKVAPNFDWALGYDGTDTAKLSARFSKNIDELNRKIEMNFSVKDYIE